MIAAFAFAAFAAAPGGFRVASALPTRELAVQPVIIATAGEPSIAQTTVRAEFAHEGFGLSVRLPYVTTWEPGWRDDGYGQLRLGVRGWLHTARPIALGVEVAFPAAGRSQRVSAWGSLMRETVPGGEAVMVLEMAFTPDAPLAVRFALGGYVSAFTRPIPVGDFAIAKVAPLGHGFAAVFEGELAFDPSWLTARALLRADPSRHLSLDLGVQLPLAAYAASTRTIQGIGQVRAFW